MPNSPAVQLPESRSEPDETNPNPDAPSATNPIEDTLTSGEPVLTADELRALLQDQPAMPPSNATD